MNFLEFHKSRFCGITSNSSNIIQSLLNNVCEFEFHNRKVENIFFIISLANFALNFIGIRKKLELSSTNFELLLDLL